MTIATRLNYFMGLQGVNGITLSRQTRIQPSTINKILNGKILDPRISTIQALADFFEVTTEEFLKETAQSQALNQLIYSFAEIPEAWPHIQVQEGNRFKLEYYGEDMSPFFGNGAVLEFDKKISPKNKDFILAAVKTENGSSAIVFRRLLDGGTEKYLAPMNDQFKAITFKNGDEILGVLVESYNKFL